MSSQGPARDQARAARARPAVSIALFVLVFGGVTAAVVAYRRELWDLFSAPERLRAWVAGFGALAPLVFIGLQTLQVIVFVIPGEVPQIAGGYLFGGAVGALLSVAGIGIGSAVCFGLARALGVPFVRAFSDSAQIGRLRDLANSPRSRIVFFLLFVIPGIPKDILCYIAGLSAMRFWAFFLISLIGRLPGIVGSAVMGAAAATERWLLAGITAGCALVLFVVGYLLRDKLGERIERLAHPRGREAPPTAPPPDPPEGQNTR